MHFSNGDSDSGLPPLVHIFMSAACRLLFIAGKNEELLVATVLTKCCIAENLILNILLIVSVVVSMKTNKSHYFQSSLLMYLQIMKIVSYEN